MPPTPDEVEFPPFYGTEGNDVVYESDLPTVDTTVYGLGGNDVFYVSAIDAWQSFDGGPLTYPDDYFYGGSGSDTISYVLSDKKIYANLETGITYRIHNNVAQSTDHLSSVENLTGSHYADTIDGSSRRPICCAVAAATTRSTVENGNDQIFGDSGNDALSGGLGDDTMDGGTGNDVMDGDNGTDTMNGSDGADTMEGGMGNDVIKGGAHNDTLQGQGGDDRIEGGSGSDTINGGAGIDTSFTPAPARSRCTCGLAMHTAPGVTTL